MDFCGQKLEFHGNVVSEKWMKNRLKWIYLGTNIDYKPLNTAYNIKSGI